MTNDADKRLAELGLSPEAIAQFCACLNEATVDAEEDFARLAAHFKLSAADAALVRRYLEESGPF